jgi:nucleotide-binding universal stress UspA family protein
MNTHTATLVGMKSSRYRQLKMELEEAIAAIPYRIQLQEINSVDHILDQALSSIPAVLIDGQVIFDNGHLPQREELLNHMYLNLDKPLTIQRIVVPIDFSKNSIAAFQFAQQLAIQFQSKISLLHVLHIYTDGGIPESYSLDFSMKQAEEQISQFLTQHRLSEGKRLDISTEVQLGFAGDVTVRYAKEKSADLVLMGTTGTTNWSRKLFGSVSIKVAKEADCPVLLVPPNSVYNGFKEVVFANDRKELSTTLDLLLDRLYETFNVGGHVVHVDTQPKVEVRILDEASATSRYGRPYRAVRVQSPTVVDGIHAYSQQQPIDLAVVIRQHRAFLDNLFHKSQTKEIVMQTSVPLLIFPERVAAK